MRRLNVHNDAYLYSPHPSSLSPLPPLRMNEQTPTYTLYPLVKERDPRFQDALGALDDALSLVHLFSQLPGSGKIKSGVVAKCRELVEGWNAAVVLNGGVKKTFVSIKGIYFQADVQGVEVR